MSLPEVALWAVLRRSTTGFRFRRQQAMGVYILDFYCPAARLAVELDGEAHASPEQVRHDLRRDAWLEGQGVQVLRFPAVAVLDPFGIEAVVEVITDACAERTIALGCDPPPFTGEGDREAVEGAGVNPGFPPGPGGREPERGLKALAPSTASGGPPPPLRG